MHLLYEIIPCSLVDGYRRFSGNSVCLPLFTSKIEPAGFSLNVCIYLPNCSVSYSSTILIVTGFITTPVISSAIAVHVSGIRIGGA